MGPQYDYQDYPFCPIAAQARAAVSPVIVLGGTKSWVRLIKVAESLRLLEGRGSLGAHG